MNGPQGQGSTALYDDTAPPPGAAAAAAVEPRQLQSLCREKGKGAIAHILTHIIGKNAAYQNLMRLATGSMTR